MPNAARQGDNHTCPSVEPGPTPHVGGPIQSGSPDVEIEFMPAARAGVDAALCQAGGPDKIAQGSGTVLINNKHAARVGDLTSHAGVIVGFAGTVEIGVPGDAVTVLPIKKRDATSASQGDGGGSKGKGEAKGGKDGSESADGKEGGDDTPLDKGVFARFRVLSPLPLVEGHDAEFECRSYDPDTGGTEATPNPDEIKWRNWQLILAQGGGSTRTVQQHSEGPRVKIEVPPLGPTPPSQLLVDLYVLDRSDHNDAHGRGVYVRPTQPLARIAEVAQLTKPGTKVGTLLYECRSLYDSAYTMGWNADTNTRHIVRRTWTLKTSTATHVLPAVAGTAGPDSRIEVDRSLFIDITKTDEAPLIELEIENSYGRKATATVLMTNHAPPVAVIRRTSGSVWDRRENWRMFGGADKVLDGDRIVFVSDSYLEGWRDARNPRASESFVNMGIDQFRWTISRNGQLVAELYAKEVEWVASQPGLYTVQLVASNAYGESTDSGAFEVLSLTDALLTHLRQLLVSAGVAASIAAVAGIIMSAPITLPAAAVAAFWAAAGGIVSEFMKTNGAGEFTSSVAGAIVGAGGANYSKIVYSLTRGQYGVETRLRLLALSQGSPSEAIMKRKLEEEIVRAMQNTLPGFNQTVSTTAAEEIATKIINYHLDDR